MNQLEVEQNLEAEARRRSQWEEFDDYIRHAPISFNDDPLLWWKNNESRYPTIASLARQYLAIPASSTPSERIFSTCGNILTKKRNKLNDEHLAMMVWLHSHRNDPDMIWFLPHWKM